MSELNQQALFHVNELKRTMAMAYKQAKAALADGKMDWSESLQMTLIGTQFAMQLQSMVKGADAELSNAIEYVLMEGEFTLHE